MTVPQLTQIEQQAICDRHQFAALHTPPRSKQMQFYVMLGCNTYNNQQMHQRMKSIPTWDVAPTFDWYKTKLTQDIRQLESKVKRNGKQNLIALKGTFFRGRYFIAHLYKYDLCPLQKLEVGIPIGHENTYASKLEMASEALLCMEQVLPTEIEEQFPSKYHKNDYMLVRDFVRLG